jgi:hypothetical protein
VVSHTQIGKGASIYSSIPQLTEEFISTTLLGDPSYGGNQVIQYDTPKFSNFKIKEVVLPEKYIRVSDQIMFLEVIERSEARKSVVLDTKQSFY